MGIDKDEFEQWAEGRSTSEVMDQFMGQLLLIMAERLGGEVYVPLVEADEQPRGKIMTMEINKTDKPGFHFKVVRKQ